MSYDFESDADREKVRAAAEAVDIAERCENDAKILDMLGESVGIDTLRSAGKMIERLRKANLLLVMSAPSFKKRQLQKLYPYLADLVNPDLIR